MNCFNYVFNIPYWIGFCCQVRSVKYITLLHYCILVSSILHFCAIAFWCQVYCTVYNRVIFNARLKPVMGLRALILEKGRFRQHTINLRQHQSHAFKHFVNHGDISVNWLFGGIFRTMLNI